MDLATLEAEAAVKRYDLEMAFRHGGHGTAEEMVERPDGDWVPASEALALEAEVARLRGELARWEAAAEKAAAQTNELLGMAERGQWYLRQLAAANALLEQWRGRAWRLKGEKELKAATEAHLAGHAARRRPVRSGDGSSRPRRGKRGRD